MVNENLVSSWHDFKQAKLIENPLSGSCCIKSAKIKQNKHNKRLHQILPFYRKNFKNANLSPLTCLIFFILILLLFYHYNTLFFHFWGWENISNFIVHFSSENRQCEEC